MASVLQQQPSDFQVSVLLGERNLQVGADISVKEGGRCADLKVKYFLTINKYGLKGVARASPPYMRHSVGVLLLGELDLQVSILLLLGKSHLQVGVLHLGERYLLVGVLILGERDLFWYLKETI